MLERRARPGHRGRPDRRPAAVFARLREEAPGLLQQHPGRLGGHPARRRARRAPGPARLPGRAERARCAAVRAHLPAHGGSRAREEGGGRGAPDPEPQRPQRRSRRAGAADRRAHHRGARHGYRRRPAARRSPCGSPCSRSPSSPTWATRSPFERWYRAVGSGGVASVNDPAARTRALAARDELERFLAPYVERTPPGPRGRPDLLARHRGVRRRAAAAAARSSPRSSSSWPPASRPPSGCSPACCGTPPPSPTCGRGCGEHRDDEDAVAALSAEALRYFPPVNGLMRRTVADVDDRRHVGCRRGSGSACCWSRPTGIPRSSPIPSGSAPTATSARGAGQFTAAGEILPFGAGTHYCVGARLAQTEMRHALRRARCAGLPGSSRSAYRLPTRASCCAARRRCRWCCTPTRRWRA